MLPHHKGNQPQAGPFVVRAESDDTHRGVEAHEAQSERSRTLIVPAERLLWRLAEVAKALGMSRRTIERERSAGRFPALDLHIGKAPLWRPETIRRWVEGGGCR